MRIAVALPSSGVRSLQVRDLRAVLRALRESGVEAEGFAEFPANWRMDELAVFHYLRIPERHAAAPFATGLYPLGRDCQPYEPAFVSALRFPGVVWVLDPVLHHLVVGGIALRGRWREYEELLEQAFPGRGEAMLHAVASGWGTRALYRRYDPLPWLLRHQPAVCAATDAIARDLHRRGRASEVVPLASAGEVRERRAHGVRRLLVLSFHYGAPGATLRALHAVASARPDMEIAAVVPGHVLDAAVAPLAAAIGLGDRVRWLALEDDALVAELKQADAVAHLRDDPVVGERALLQEAASRSLPLVLLRAEGAHGVPAGVGMEVEPGAAYGPSLQACLEQLHDNPALAQLASARAATWASRRPGPAAVAQTLTPILRQAAAAGFREQRVSAPTWQRLEERARALVTPRFAGDAVATLAAARLRACAPHGLFDGTGRRPGAPLAKTGRR